MMKHLVIESLGLARPGLARKAFSVCGRTSSYAAATLTALTLLFGATAAQAAHVSVTRVPHARRTAASQELQTSSSHSKVRAIAKARGPAPRLAAPRVAARNTSRKPSIRRTAAIRTTPAASTHAKTRGRKGRSARAQVQQPPVEMNRASLRRSPPRTIRGSAPVQVAETHQLGNENILGDPAAANMADAAPRHPATIAHVESNDPYTPRSATLDDPAPTSDELAYLVHPSHQELSEEVAIPMVLPGLYRNGRLIVPAPLKGTHEILVHQNLMADDEGLERIQDDDDLARLRASHQLVNFPESASLRVNPELSAGRRCARIWTVRFAADIARQYYARFGQPLQVNSAARTIAYQLRLQRVNGNAAGIGGDVASPHLTGQAIDFGKSGMSIAQIAWMRAYLKPLMDSGKLDVEEEFQQACFHISVYRNYLPAIAKRPRTDLATLHTPKSAPATPRIDRDE